jgi:hypothetical protein
MDRRGIKEEAARIRFVCRALWPAMSTEQVDFLVARATADDAEPTWRLRRPVSPADVVGRDAAALMLAHMSTGSDRLREEPRRPV